MGRESVSADLHLGGTHQLKFGIDFEREAFHQKVLRHDYEVLRDDNSVARYVQFAGNPFEARKNFEAAQYIQDPWTPREGLALEAGLRVEWNEIVRDLEVAPRFSMAWAPRLLRNTKFSAGWGVYYDAISLGLVTRQPDQVSLSTFFPPEALRRARAHLVFGERARLLGALLSAPPVLAWSTNFPSTSICAPDTCTALGNRGLTFLPAVPGGCARSASASFTCYAMRGATGTTRSISVSGTLSPANSSGSPATRGQVRAQRRRGLQPGESHLRPAGAGTLSVGRAQSLPHVGLGPAAHRFLPHSLRFLTRNTTAAYLVEYRTGFPFSVVDRGRLSGGPAELSAIARLLRYQPALRTASFARCITYGHGGLVLTI